MVQQGLGPHGEIASQLAAARSNAYSGEEFGQSFVEPGGQFIAARPKERVRVFMRGHAEAVGAKRRHHDVVAGFGADVIGIGDGTQAIGLVIGDGAESDNAGGAVTG